MNKKMINLNGEINAKSGEQYKNEIVSQFAAYDTFIISFKDVVYLNSSGLREIIDLLKKANAAKKELRLCEMSKDIREMFSFTGLEKVFKIFDTQQKAME